MSNTILAPFIKWGQYKSRDQKNPDVVEIQVAEVETFETEYSINVRVRIREGDDWNEAILPLRNYNSVNDILLREWKEFVDKKIVKVGKRFLLKTWLDKSKKSDHDIRRFVLVPL